MEYTVLVIDDDEAMHYMVKKLLGQEFKLLHVRNAQGAINALAEHPINLVLSDIHMPEMNGLEFLEAITIDATKRNIPFLIMTSLPTPEKEQKALDLGAADFINKEDLNKNPGMLAEKVRLKLVTHVEVPDISDRLNLTFKAIAQQVMFEVSSGDFLSTAKKICTELEDHFQLDHISFWTISKTAPYLLLAKGIQPPANYNPKKLLEEEVYHQIADERKPYLNNNIFNDDHGVFLELSRENGLPAEIGVPIYCITEKELIHNKMKIPNTTRAFGYVLIKRKTVFTSKEYQLISKLLIQTGSVMWRLYQNM